jgi:hypothetical protein
MGRSDLAVDDLAVDDLAVDDHPLRHGLGPNVRRASRVACVGSNAAHRPIPGQRGGAVRTKREKSEIISRAQFLPN